MARKSFKDNPAMKFITSPEAQEGSKGNQPRSQAGMESPPKDDSAWEAQARPRINIAFTPEEFHYLQAIARLDGLSITEYLNSLIMADRKVRAAELESNGK